MDFARVNKVDGILTLAGVEFVGIGSASLFHPDRD
jgi:hypothetical protein